MTSNREFTIGVDARLSGKRHAGIGRYIENLLMELPAAANNANFKINWVYFFYDRDQAEAVQQALVNFNNLSFVYSPIRHYSLAEQLKWPQVLLKHNLDLLHVPHFNVPLMYSDKLVITIHDLLWHQQIGPAATTLPGWKYYLKYLAYRLVTNQAIKKSLKIFVPAKTVKKILAQHYPTQANKITVAKEGISAHFEKIYQKLKNQDPAELAARYQENKLIYVGSLYPHKNIEVVLQALVDQPKLKLMIVCARNVFMQRTKTRIKQLNLEDQVEFTGYLSDQDLIQELQTSLALIQPSKSEGFGLTGVEAMACGTPVIASDISVFKEVYQTAPIYFDPDNEEQLLSAVKQLTAAERRQTAIKQGFEIVSEYSWQDMAEKIFNSYVEILTN